MFGPYLELFHSRRTPVRLMTLFAVGFVLPLWCYGQTDPPAVSPAPPPESKRLFGILPNHRTAPTFANYKPLTTKQKFKIGLQDSFDWGTVVLALAFAAKGQLSNTNPSYGQGTAGFAKYFAAGYSDVVIGDMMTEAIYPSLMHQDPRYFRRGTGSGWSRLRYAVAQIFVTHNDSGRRQFNYSEILGTTTAVVISNSYYPDGRDAGSNASKFGVQIGIDMAGNVLKEFAPDITRKFSRQHSSPGAAGATRAHK